MWMWINPTFMQYQLSLGQSHYIFPWKKKIDLEGMLFGKDVLSEHVSSTVHKITHLHESQSTFNPSPLTPCAPLVVRLKANAPAAVPGSSGFRRAECGRSMSGSIQTHVNIVSCLSKTATRCLSSCDTDASVALGGSNAVRVATRTDLTSKITGWTQKKSHTLHNNAPRVVAWVDKCTPC